MQFDRPLVLGKFVRRYKRFFVDVELASGETVVAHCPNTGSLQGCLEPGAPVMVLENQDPKRSLRFSWKLIQLGDAWVGVDTGLAVPLVEEAIAQGVLSELGGYERALREVRYGRDQSSRIDILLSRGGRLAPAVRSARALHEGDQRVYVEVKNTTLTSEGVALFPDAVTARGQKHLEELMHVVSKGQRAAMVFCVQRSDCRTFRPADAIDPIYGKLLRRAHKRGVELFALAASATPQGVTVNARLPVQLA